MAVTVKQVNEHKSKYKLTDSQKLIQKDCRHVEALLLKKNRAYGNSALDPIRIFSGADSTEQLMVRIDDKLNRLRTRRIAGAKSADIEDTVLDLIGYLHLLRVANTLKEK